MSAGILATPQVYEAREGARSASECRAPHAGELDAGIGMRAGIALEVMFVEQLHAPCRREVGGVAVVGRANQCSLLKTAEAVQPAVVFGVQGRVQGWGDDEFTRNLGVGCLRESAAEVDVDEVVPRPPFVGFELLDGGGHFRSAGLFVGIDIAAEVVMQLYVLCRGCRRRCGKQASEGKCLQ